MVENYTVEQVRQCCANVLPLQLYECMSTPEVLTKLTKRLNEVIEITNGLPEYIEKLIIEYLTGGPLGDLFGDILRKYFLTVKNPPNKVTPAVGDGSEDDTAAFQACIDYANINNCAVYVPCGKYLVSPLTLKSNVTLVGAGKRVSTLVLKGGANSPLISGNVENAEICGLTLDANMDIQVNNIDCVNLVASNSCIKDVIFTDGYDNLAIEKNGGVIALCNLEFISAVEHFIHIGGSSGVVRADGIIFGSLSTLKGESGILSDSDGDYFKNILCTQSIVTGVELNGDNNVVEGYINSNIPVADMGSNNSVFLSKTSVDANYSGAVKATAKSIELNPAEPLIYKTPTKLNNYFDYVEFQDNSGSIYDVLVSNGKNFKLDFQVDRFGGILDFLYHDVPKGFTVQGFTIVGDVLVIATADNSVNNNTTFYKFEMSTKNLIGTYSGQWYHANSIVVDVENDLLYSLDALDYSSGSFKTIGSITVLKYSTMQFLRRINTDVPEPTGLGLVNGVLYNISALGGVYSVDLNTGNITLVTTLETVLCGTSQACFMDTNYIYWVRSNYNAIIVYNYDGSVHHVIDIGGCVPYSLGVQEAEAVYVSGDDIYLLSYEAAFSNDISNINATNSFALFKGNLNYMTPPALKYNGALVNTIYVNNTDVVSSPNGTSLKPFNYIQDAIKMIKSMPAGKYVIQLSNAGPFNEVLTVENMSGYDVRIQPPSGVVPIIKGGMYQRDGHVYFRNVTFDVSNMYIGTTDGTYTSRCVIKIYAFGHVDCNLALDGTSFINAPTEDYTKYIISAQNSGANLYLNSTFDDSTKVIPSWLSGAGSNAIIIDNGTYIAYSDNVIYENKTQATFNRYVGRGRYRIISGLTGIAPGSGINLNTQYGIEEILSKSIVRFNFSNGTVICTKGGELTSTFCTAKQVGGVTYIIRARAWITGNYTVTWDAHAIALNVTKGTVAETSVVTDVSLGYTALTAEDRKSVV